jgi:hypothetical protein
VMPTACRRGVSSNTFILSSIAPAGWRLPVCETAAALIILVDSAFRRHNWGCLFINEGKRCPAGFLSSLNLWAVRMSWAKALPISEHPFLAKTLSN